MALWRTSALAALALAASSCGQAQAPSAQKPATHSRPALLAVQQQPLKVKGTGFQPGEHVRVSAKGLRSATAKAEAASNGSFTVTLRGLQACDSVTVVAAGSRGSKASFNLSQYVCP